MMPPEAEPATGWEARPTGGSTGASVGWPRAARAAAEAGLRDPRLWPLALVSFLLRGGLILYLVPIVVIPSTVGVATIIGPTAITPAGPSEGFVRLVAGFVLVLVAWFVAGGLIAAAAEAALIDRSLRNADDGQIEGETREPGRPVSLALAVRILLVRFVASMPLVVVLAWVIPRVAGAAYHELTNPRDTATSLPARVLLDVPEVVVVVLLAWLLAETVGGLAVRRIVLFGEGGPAATFTAASHLVRRPIATLATIVVLLCGSLFLVVPGLVAAGLGWQRLGHAIVGDAGIGPVLALTVLFVAVWCAGLALAAAAAAWRNVAWTLEVLRVEDEAMARNGVLQAGFRRLVETGARPTGR